VSGTGLARARSAPAAGNGGPGRLPDFFIAGHPKSGTTALYEMLREHPQIFLPAEKEPWFFATELHERPPPRPSGIPATLADYAALYEDAQEAQRAGDASPMYLWSRTAAARIAAACPDARIVVILREPVGFLRSLHLQFVQTYVESEPDFARAIALEPARRAGREIPRHTYWPKALVYSDFVRYVEQLRRYEELFAPEQLKVMIYDDFRADNEHAVREVLRFLDVDDSFRVASVEANPTVSVRNRRLHELVHALSVGHGPASRTVKNAIKAVTPRRARRKALHATQRRVIFTEPEPADEGLTAELRGRFRGEVAALSAHLGRDLIELWGYDDGV
jgi:hypothetical protein